MSDKKDGDDESHKRHKHDESSRSTDINVLLLHCVGARMTRQPSTARERHYYDDPAKHVKFEREKSGARTAARTAAQTAAQDSAKDKKDRA